VIPPRNRAGTTSQPRMRPATNPGVKFSTRSRPPTRAVERSDPTNSRAEYSSPSENSNRINSISAPASMNSSAVTRGINPPCPNASPANRYRGMGENPTPWARRARDCEEEDDTAELDQEQRVPHHSPERSRTTRSSIPRGVPTTTTMSPPRSPKSGPGAGYADPARRTATIETPVLVRAPVSPIVRPANGYPCGSGSRSTASPSTSWPSSTRSLATCETSRRSATARLSSGPSRTSTCEVSGSSRSNRTSSRTPDRWCTTATDTVLGQELVSNADPGQRDFIDERHQPHPLAVCRSGSAVLAATYHPSRPPPQSRTRLTVRTDVSASDTVNRTGSRRIANRLVSLTNSSVQLAISHGA
jgi:hypothetical protein